MRTQNIIQGHDALQLVYICAAHHGQKFELIHSHAFQSHIKPSAWT